MVYFEETEKITVIDKIIKYILFTNTHPTLSYQKFILCKDSPQ